MQVGSPYLRKGIGRLEKVQARVTKMIPTLRNTNYQKHLERVNLFSLETRRFRGQLIKIYKILKGVNNYTIRFELNKNYILNHDFKLVLKNSNIVTYFLTEL